MKRYNVFYRKNGELFRYCLSAMDKPTAVIYRDKFNAKYYDKPYPNGKGVYNVSKAWIDFH